MHCIGLPHNITIIHFYSVNITTWKKKKKSALMTQHNTRSKEKTTLQDSDCETNIKGKSATPDFSMFCTCTVPYALSG